MKPASPELEAILASGGPYIFADLYTFELRNGVTLRYTSGDRDITHDGELFRSGGEISGYALVTGGRMRCVKGLEVDTTEISIAPGVNDTVNGIPMLKAIRQGQFDRAHVLKERAFFALMASYGDTSPGTLIIFSGEIADATPSRTEAKLTVKSDVYLLNVSMPRKVYQASCPHTLGDDGCGVDRSLYAVTSTTLTGSTAVSIVCGLAQASGHFDLGTVTFNSGANAGLSRSIKAYEPGSVTLTAPFPNVPEVGDAFTALPGCGKTIPVLASATQNYTISGSRTVTVANLTEDYGVTMAGLTYSALYPPGNYPDLDVYWDTERWNPSTSWYGAWVAYSTGLLASAPSYTAQYPSTAMVKASGTPGDGQYSLTGGVYTFSSANNGRQVSISYQYATENAGAQCYAIYNNVARFSGAPHIPVPETST
jgi:uncharacterized phage protein (TIGR02218 family)